MDRAKIRRWLLVALAVLAAASMFPSLGDSSKPSAPPPRHSTLVAKHQDPRSAVADPRAPVRSRP